jgi:outer membrane biosynthesis protein TonB
MNVLKSAHNRQNKERRNFIFAITISFLFHLLIFYLLTSENAYVIDLRQNLKTTPEEVVILFPENKPKQIVENRCENEEVPEESDLLSERNSRARNESLLEQEQNQPYSMGNSPFANLSPPRSPAQDSYAKKPGSGVTEKFSRRALLGDKSFPIPDDYQTDEFTSASQETYVRRNDGTNNLYHQKEFSADELGNLTLSTYAWEWASYINYFKRKLYEVWRTPPAYFSLGIIHGYTVIRLVIDRNGQMVSIQVLEHQGHSSLQVSSENAVNAVFPLKPLPVDFPDETLTLTLTLLYPQLRKRSN